MAFENSLPVGSTPFSNILYKDPADKIWTGDEFAGRFYRFLDPADLPYINIKDYGAVGDGVTDDTAAWDEALSVAKAMEMALYFPSGQYPITVDVDTVDMNGCLGFTGAGELVFSTTGNPDEALLRWTGTKEMIAGPIASTSGQSQWTVGTGKSIKKGDTILIASFERMYEDSLVQPYMRGDRLTVDTYDPVTGILTTNDYAYYNIAAAYVYHNSVRPIVKFDGVRITLASDPDKKGIQVDVGEVYISNVQMSGFGRFCYSSSSSLTRVINSSFFVSYVPANGVGYGVQSADLSDVIVTSSICYGGRHGLMTGGNAYWKTEDVGQPAGSHIFLPSHCKAIGCRIEGKVYALDSHAGTTILEVINCDVFGGAIFGAYENYISNSRIRQGTAEMAIRFGRDRSDSDYFYSVYSVSKCDVYANTQAFGVYCNPNVLEINEVNVIASPSASARTFFAFNSASRAKKLVLKGLRHAGSDTDDVNYSIYVASPSEISDMVLENARMIISIRSAVVRSIALSNIRIRTSQAFGISISASDPAHNKTFDMLATGLRIMDAGQSLSIRGVRRMTVSDSAIYGATISIFVGLTTGGDMWLSVSGSTIDQATGTIVASQAGQVSNLTLVGNIIPTANTVNANVVLIGKYGNIGLNDKLKTALTTATTTKYGSDTTTGDLTLS